MTLHPVRMAVLPDFPEEDWPSMDRCADRLLAHLPAEIVAQRCVPRFRRLFGTAFGRTGYNADRLLNRFITFPRFARRLVGQFDVFHVVDHTYAQLVHALPADRTGVYCHDLDAFRCLVDPGKDPRPRWFRILARRILTGLQKAAIVFHNSRQTRDELLRFELIDPVRLIHAPLGVASEFTPEPSNPPAQEADYLSRVAGRPWLLHVGSCIPRKRIDVLLAILAAVRQAVPDVMLVKIGGEWTAAQHEQIEKLGLADAIVHAGAVSNTELAQAYRLAKAVLVPSEAEGFGLPVIEGLACSAVVIASDIPALREAGGPAAVYVPVADLAAWTDAVIRVLTNPAFPPSREKRLSWARQFTWENHAATIAEAYRCDVLHMKSGL
jgi:glycosyltransferase involved in cell wall biosynthesis